MKLELTSTQIEQLVGLRVNTLHYYVQAGAIVPDISTGAGRGTKRLFGSKNLVEVIIVKRMIEMHVGKQKIVEAMKSLRTDGEYKKKSLSELGDPVHRYLSVFSLEKGQMVHRLIKFSDEDSLKTLWQMDFCAITVNLSHIIMEYYIKLHKNGFPVDDLE